MLNENDKSSLLELQSLIEKVKNVQQELAGLGDEIYRLKVSTFVGEAVPFTIGRDDAIFDTCDNVFNRFLKIESTVARYLEKDIDVKFEIGDMLTANNDARFLRDEISHDAFHVKPIGSEYFVTGRKFTIIDFDGSKYTLIYEYSNSLIKATEKQLALFFDKTDKKTTESYFKVEFSLNGPKYEYSKDIDHIRIWTNNRHCPEREGGDWQFDYNPSFKSIGVFMESADEAFGVNGVAYFKGMPVQFTQSIPTNVVNDLIINCGSRNDKKDRIFVMGFSRKNNDAALRYNGRISIFHKDHLPKDVFTSSVKGRLVHIFSIKQTFEYQSAGV